MLRDCTNAPVNDNGLPMITQQPHHLPFFHSTRAWILLCIVPLMLTGCGGSIGGSGQSPDPVVADFPIAYVKRPLPLDNQGNPVRSDTRRVLTFNQGGDLFIRDRASTTATERNITASVTGGKGDVKDVDVSFDGKRLLFALHAPIPKDTTTLPQPTWNIWEYDIENDQLRRVITSDITADAGDDVSPHYLPDNRIVFSSTRQRQARAVLLDEGKPQFAAMDEDLREQATVLHVMNADGTDIHQISFNQSHDIDPTVLSDGKILFSRWDDAGSRNAISLYTIHPDGTELQMRYGAHSHNTGTNKATVQFLQPREMPSGKIMALLEPTTSSQGGGDLITIDIANHLDNDQAVWSSRGTTAGPGQTSATVNSVRTDNQPSPGGRFASAYPLWDGTARALVTWSPCRLVENNAVVPCTTERLAATNTQQASPLYGVWMYDLNHNTQLPVVPPEEGMILADAVAALPREALPAILYDKTAGLGLDSTLMDEGAGILQIRSVYDLDGVDTSPTGIAALADPLQSTADQRPARFLRIVKSVSIPSRDDLKLPGTAFGASRQRLMREIIGYVPIEPDGSVMAKVPANVPLAISILDKDGRRISAEHQNWIQVRPGETRECNGCHAHNSGLPHGTPLGPPSINPGATTTGLPFPNTDPNLWSDTGETMAQTRARISCQTDCAALNPHVDILYDDVWTDTTLRAKDPSFSYRYADLDTPAPATSACQTQWDVYCRIVINYEQHIHPLWAKTRQQLAVDGVTVLADHTCTTCHNAVDGTDAPQVPAAQLDLSDGPSSDEPTQFKAYRELLVTDNKQELVGGTLQDVLVPGTDADGQPIMVPVPVSPSLSVAGAHASRFFDVFSPGGSHEGWLTPAELRLLSEWVDIGAQYYNDPFDAPTN